MLAPNASDLGVLMRCLGSFDVDLQVASSISAYSNPISRSSMQTSQKKIGKTEVQYVKQLLAIQRQIMLNLPKQPID